MKNLSSLWTRCSRRAAIAAVAMVGAVGWSQGVHADLINIESDEANSSHQLGSFTGSIEYDFDLGLNSWTVLITLNNTSDPGSGGHITGFVFNIDSADANASATLHSGTHPFLNAPNQNVQDYGGTFDAGAALLGNFNGGGPPDGGIAVGQSGSFLFIVNASDAAALTASSFIEGPFDFNFLVRFRGFANGGSDKVPAVIEDPPIPGPAALMMMAIGLVLVRPRTRSA